MNTVPAIIEKDFWVVWVLDKLFDHERLKSILQFKGGTSLSKVYNVIGRFSEDIDLILDWREVTKDDPELPRKNNSQQSKFNEKVNLEAQVYIREMLLPLITDVLQPHCRCVIDEDPHAIKVAYPVLNQSAYLRPEILLEIGPLASWTPSDVFEVSSYAAQYFPKVFDRASCKVPTILAKRTFWEKATILHQEAHRASEKAMPPRYSRHYYDLALMAQSAIKDEALADMALLQEVVAFKRQFYPSAWARYDLARPGSLKLIPSKERLNEIASDFDRMQEMIFAKKLSLDEILSTLMALQDEINEAGYIA
ncbi:MAG: nucleotidyl transferase AbiEii/AbiGii toxin family protein [Methylophaga sp.]